MGVIHTNNEKYQLNYLTTDVQSAHLLIVSK